MLSCKIHNCEFKLIPAGISKKTGKNYSAFYTCQIKDCKERPPQDNSSMGQFSQQLDLNTLQNEGHQKGRCAIACSLIERGEKWGAEAWLEASAWEAWMLTGKPFTKPSTSPNLTSQGEFSPPILPPRYDDIPVPPQDDMQIPF